MYSSLRNQKGQALLIIVLLMAVALTVSLAVVSRSITDIKISRQEEESARVFSAAEAGIEEALKANFTSPQDVVTLIGGINITARVEPGRLGELDQSFVFPKQVEADDTQTFWLVAHDETGGLLDPSSYYQGNLIRVYWGNEGTPADSDSTPALEAILVFKQGSDYKLARYAIDPNSTRRIDNRFSDVSGSDDYEVSGKKFQFLYEGITIPVGVIPYLLRLKLIYNTQPHVLALSGTADFPYQGKCYESTAVLPTPGITRKVRQCQFYPAPPGIFDYVLFSGGNLVK